MEAFQVHDTVGLVKDGVGVIVVARDGGTDDKIGRVSKFDCLVIEPVLETSAIFENTGKLTIWLTDDNFRMPVLMRSKVAVGSFEAVLKEFTLAPDRPLILETEGSSR